MRTPWPVAGDGCICWVNPNPFTHYGAVEPGDALEPNPECQMHFGTTGHQPINSSKEGKTNG